MIVQYYSTGKGAESMYSILDLQRVTQKEREVVHTLFGGAEGAGGADGRQQDAALRQRRGQLHTRHLTPGRGEAGAGPEPGPEAGPGSYGPVSGYQGGGGTRARQPPKPDLNL